MSYVSAILFALAGAGVIAAATLDPVVNVLQLINGCLFLCASLAHLRIAYLWRRMS